jgi:FtsH-binding integral membrane protein
MSPCLSIVLAVLLLASFFGWVSAVERFNLGDRTALGGIAFLVLSGIALLCVVVASVPMHSGSPDDGYLWFFVGYSIGR